MNDNWGHAPMGRGEVSSQLERKKELDVRVKEKEGSGEYNDVAVMMVGEGA